MSFCEDTPYVLVDLFVKILTRKREKDLQLIWPLKYDLIFFRVFKLLLPPVLKMAAFSSRFVQANSAQNIVGQEL